MAVGESSHKKDIPLLWLPHDEWVDHVFQEQRKRVRLSREVVAVKSDARQLNEACLAKNRATGVKPRKRRIMVGKMELFLMPIVSPATTSLNGSLPRGKSRS